MAQANINSNINNSYVLCRVCSHLILLDDENILTCEVCGNKDDRLKPKSATLTVAFSLTALILYIPANVFPFMTVELYGNRNSSTIYGGIVSLAESGSLGIALIIFLASILIPILKIVVLFYLSLTVHSKKHQRFKTQLYRFVEAIGRWSMLDIFLLAVLVAILRLGHFASAKPEIGSIIFAFVVIFTMLASASFDSKLLWESQNGKDTPVG